MKRKAQGMPLNVIAIAILCLIVLIVLAIIFREQITKGANRYDQIGKSAEADIKGDACISFLAVRQCSAANPGGDYEWSNLGKRDCGNNGDCWERGEKKV